MDVNAPGNRPAQSRSVQGITPTPASQLAKSKRNKKKWLLPTIGVLVILAVLYGVLSWLHIVGPLAGVKSERYQAVFLTNNQVYFGKINSITSDTITLRDVYYLKESSNSNAEKDTSNTQKQVQLAQLGAGGEVHSPDSEMRISRLQVLFWENMKDDSQVVKTIKQNK